MNKQLKIFFVVSLMLMLVIGVSFSVNAKTKEDKYKDKIDKEFNKKNGLSTGMTKTKDVKIKDVKEEKGVAIIEFTDEKKDYFLITNQMNND